MFEGEIHQGDLVPHRMAHTLAGAGNDDYPILNLLVMTGCTTLLITHCPETVLDARPKHSRLTLTA